jgi:hypothetical protein
MQDISWAAAGCFCSQKSWDITNVICNLVCRTHKFFLGSYCTSTHSFPVLVQHCTAWNVGLLLSFNIFSTLLPHMMYFLHISHISGVARHCGNCDVRECDMPYILIFVPLHYFLDAAYKFVDTSSTDKWIYIEAKVLNMIHNSCHTLGSC